MAEYSAMCSTAEELLHLVNGSGTLWIQSEHDTLLRHSVAARGITQRSRLVKDKAVAARGIAQRAGLDVTVARGCSRERATDQVDYLEGKQG